MKKLLCCKHYILIVLSCFIVNQSNAQVGYQKENLLDKNFEADIRKFVKADINGDGNTDILFSAFYGYIGWFENLGQLIFSSYRPIFDIDEINNRDFIAFDVDFDGDLDVITSTNDHIYWCENIDSKGTFADPQIMIEINRATTLGLGDVDNDGDDDILAAGEGAPSVWIENTGDVNDYIAHEWGVSISYNRKMIVVDLDDDGDNDIVYSGDKGLIGWAENDGQNSFNEKHKLGGFGGNPDITVFDLDADGDLDVLYTGFGWVENFGGGDFNSKKTIEIDNDFDQYFIDLDYDGIDDILGVDDGVVYVTYIKSDFTFNSISIPVEESWTLIPYLFDDFDKDGDFDYCGYKVHYSTNYLNVYQNDEYSLFKRAFRLNYYRRDFSAVELADIDNDGDEDLVVEDNHNENVFWLENNGQNLNNWVDHSIIDTSFSSSYTNISIADIDGDSDLDIVKDYMGESMFWVENVDGNGIFGPPIHFADFDERVLNIVSTDIDNDGDPDVVVGFENSVKVYINENGLGVFSDGMEIYQGVKLSNIKTANLNGDDFKDILITTTSNGTFWHKNINAAESFGDSVQIYEGYYGSGISDLDNDGDVDIYQTRQNQDHLYWYVNDGQGNFETKSVEISGAEDAIRVLTASDLDRDGDKDLIVYATNGYDFGWLENKSESGGFENYEYLLTNEEKNLIYWVPSQNSDVDNDGDEDLVIAQRDEVFIYVNNANGNFINGQVKFSNELEDCETSPYGLKNVLVEADSDFEYVAVNTNENGMYVLPLDFNGYYNVQSILPNSFVNSSPAFYEYEFDGSGEVVMNDFCFTPNNSEKDLSIDIYSDRPRPGFDLEYQLIYTNNGTNVMDGEINFEFDETIITFLESSIVPESQLANSLKFSFAGLFPFKTGIIDLKFKVFTIPDVNLGDELTVKGTITPIDSDTNPDDNVYEYIREVVGSYDPNDIQVMEGAKILESQADDYLHYKIRFQNTGNFLAENVRVTNEIDPLLNYSTMVLGASSHPYTMTIMNGKDIEFKFDNINLPDSISNEPESHGFITYKIKPLPDFSLGDIVYNDAEIYFDFNPPIETNTVSTEVVEIVNVEDIKLNEVVIYPNPAEEKIYISSKQTIDKFEVFDALGTLSLVKSGSNELDIAKLAVGIYYMRVHLHNGNFVLKKFIKL